MARRSSTSARGEGAERRRLRCAVYTRKSSEEGLEQSFNSLHAQRDACEAFILSQKHEGWVLLPEAYDDGGLSGGSMERPALQRLIDEVKAGLVDIVVVYKVDRLTRSLADFAKLTELFDAHGTSFVSVTQAFNTSTSMGRLTLNVLLSFAQFEREVAGERIRDKIALSKRRGMWMGGLPPLGYDGIDRKLVVNAAEAETVRLIFRRYLEVGSIAVLKRSLDADGIASKRRVFSDGRKMGDVSLSRGALYQILRNRLYRGEIAHRGVIHAGEHDAIVDEELWIAVQERLAGQAIRRRGIANGTAATAPLAGLIFDDKGNRMSPTHAVKAGRRYSYYISASLVRGGGDHGIRVPAPDIEKLVLTSIADRLCNRVEMSRLVGVADLPRLETFIDAAAKLGALIRDGQPGTDGSCLDLIRKLVQRIEVGAQSVSITLDPAGLSKTLETFTRGSEAPKASAREGGSLVLELQDPVRIAVVVRLQRCGKQVRLILGEVDSIVRQPDPDLVRLVQDARRWFDDLRTGRAATIAAIAKRDRQQVSHVSRTISLAFLAPDITRMIVEGRQPIGLTSERLKAARPLPLDWNEQRSILLD